MSKDQLRPCPFCSSKVKLHRGLYGVTFVLCDHCGACVSFRGKEQREAVLKIWNGGTEVQNEGKQIN